MSKHPPLKNVVYITYNFRGFSQMGVGLVVRLRLSNTMVPGSNPLATM